LKGEFNGDGFQRGEEETAGVDEADKWVPPVIGGRGGEVTLLGFWPGGPWADSEVGPNGFPGAFFVFFDFFSPFLFSDFRFVSKSFANLFQFKSNKFLEPSDIHCSVLNH
jgi:hypothetical protein